MRFSYKFLIIFCFCSCVFAYSQENSINNEFTVIDSLIQNFQYDLAQKNVDKLNSKFSGKEQKNTKQFLEFRYRQAFLLDTQNFSPAKILEILFELLKQAEAKNLQSLICRTYLLIALSYEKGENIDLTGKYLNSAFEIYKKYNLENLYSTYCIRKSSYCRYVNQLEKSFYYAQQAEIYAKKYNNSLDLNDSYLLLGNYYSVNNQYKKALKYFLLQLDFKRNNKNNSDLSNQLNNVGRIYMKMKNFDNALLYNDSAYTFYNKLLLIDKFPLPQLRYMIYEKMGNTDSAFHYFKQYKNDFELLTNQEEIIKTKKIESQYQKDKIKTEIKEKDRQMILVAGFLIVIAIATILLLKKNRQINHRNKIINQQLGELTKLLEQKQVLLSELQHRVKNNLQHVISILEIQKESADFNNIDELIRGNQNRIHSMALLHKKLNVSDNVNDIDFKRYINDLSEIVKESYDNDKKKIDLSINCEIETISIEKALPIGLILVELISNSIKHAFKKRKIGIINIEITKNEDTKTNKLYYSDNGDGFDFNKVNDKGLGLEITKGLIDQIDGTVETKTNNGFELLIYFK